jgi:PTH1 family peptidyl-tRNA hydrolase
LSSGIALIVGLGNPGADYEHTRHNAGAWFVLNLAQSIHTTLHFENKFKGLHSSLTLHGHPVHLLIPTTFMNLSGQAVNSVAKFYKIAPENILVAHDDLDLAVGDIRLKFDGGHGGHNGLRDMIDHLQTNKFHRLRIGIGHPGNSHEVTNYVLKPPHRHEREEIETAITSAEKIIPDLLDGKFQKAMQDLHTREK